MIKSQILIQSENICMVCKCKTGYYPHGFPSPITLDIKGENQAINVWENIYCWLNFHRFLKIKCNFPRIPKFVLQIQWSVHPGGLQVHHCSILRFYSSFKRQISGSNISLTELGFFVFKNLIGRPWYSSGFPCFMKHKINSTGQTL